MRPWSLAQPSPNVLVPSITTDSTDGPWATYTIAAECPSGHKYTIDAGQNLTRLWDYRFDQFRLCATCRQPVTITVIVEPAATP